MVLSRRNGERVWSAIAKQPVEKGETLWLSFLNLAGDGQADLTVHGGIDKAVYAYPSEHLERWQADLGGEFGSAPFGENISTHGVVERDVCIGDIWSWGTARLQVSQPRWPCFKLALHRDRADIQVRMRQTGRTGWYLRVLQPGEVPVAGPIAVTEHDPREVTVEHAHLAMADRELSDRDRVQAVVDHPSLAAQWREPLAERLARQS